MLRLAPLVALLGVLLPASLSLAQYEDWEALEDERTLEEEAEAFGVELDPGGRGRYSGLFYSEFTFFHKQDNSGISFLFGLEYEPMDTLRVEVVYGLSGAILGLPGDNERDFSSANPYLAGYYVHELGEWPNEMALVMGAGVALPAARTDLTSDGIAPPDAPSEVGALGYFYALTMRGLRDPWLWAPDVAAPVFTFDFESHLRDLIFETGLDVAIFIPVRDRAGGAEAVFQWKMKAGYRPIDAIEFGLGASSVITTGTLIEGSGQRAQGAMDLYLLGRVGGVVLGLDFLTNVGKPFGEGFLSRGQTLWGLTAGVGVELP